MKVKASHRLNIGGASIILILLVFALTVFAVLSIRTSYHELKLAEKTRDSVEAYYNADSKAEETLMLLDDKLAVFYANGTEVDLKELYSELLKVEGVTEITEQDKLVNYEVNINDSSILKVKLKLDLTMNNNPAFAVESWKMVTAEQGSYDTDEIDIWDGTIEE